MADALAEALEGAAVDESVRAVLLTGEGLAFSAGANLSAPGSAADYDSTVLDRANRISRAILNCPKPVVAAVNGVAAGFGVSIALACDLMVASDSAAFVFAFPKVGLMPDGGMSATLAASVGRARAMRWLMTGATVTAGEAFEVGLVASLYPDADLAVDSLALATRLAAGPPLALAVTKRAVNRQTLPEVELAFETEKSGQATLFRTADFAEGLAAFAERRRPTFTGD